MFQMAGLQLGNVTIAARQGDLNQVLSMRKQPIQMVTGQSLDQGGVTHCSLSDSFLTKVSSTMKFVSQVMPPSVENACSK